MRWIIAYDIQDAKPRRKVAKALECLGFRRQFSLFEGEATRAEVETLLDLLAEMLNPNTDQITAWPIPSDPAAHLHRGQPQSISTEPWRVL